ncbi:MAG: hypothetical protein NPIRA02_02420 [Nitrospirales bacterium]|nr:MAG: hypothetical protein NPIRA02_02420 [Nitrospirales bacterium]
MPRIFDNIEQALLPALRETIQLADRADFCVGYFNLRGWKQLDGYIDKWSGKDGHCCRLLVGMQRLPQDELREALSLVKKDSVLDNQTAIRLKKKLAEEFREQLTVGIPTNEDEIGLHRLAAQIKAKKVVVKLFLRHPLHAKLYQQSRGPRALPVGECRRRYFGMLGEWKFDSPDTVRIARSTTLYGFPNIVGAS